MILDMAIDMAISTSVAHQLCCKLGFVTYFDEFSVPTSAATICSVPSSVSVSPRTIMACHSGPSLTDLC